MPFPVTVQLEIIQYTELQRAFLLTTLNAIFLCLLLILSHFLINIHHNGEWRLLSRRQGANMPPRGGRPHIRPEGLQQWNHQLCLIGLHEHIHEYGNYFLWPLGRDLHWLHDQCTAVLFPCGKKEKMEVKPKEDNGNNTDLELAVRQVLQRTGTPSRTWESMQRTPTAPSSEIVVSPQNGQKMYTY